MGDPVVVILWCVGEVSKLRNELGGPGSSLLHPGRDFRRENGQQWDKNVSVCLFIVLVVSVVNFYSKIFLNFYLFKLMFFTICAFRVVACFWIILDKVQCMTLHAGLNFICKILAHSSNFLRYYFKEVTEPSKGIHSSVAR